MRELKKSEKNLILLIVVIGLLFSWSQITKKGKKKVTHLKAELVAANQNIKKTRSMLTIAVEPKAKGPLPSNDITMTLLKDLTVPKEAGGIDVVSVNRASPTNFTLTVEGRFSQMMRFLSYLERMQGKFAVDSVELKKRLASKVKGNQPVQAVTEREIQGIFNISRRG